MDQRSVVYGTSANMYQQAFAMTGFFGIAFIGFGALLLVSRNQILGGVLLTLGIIFAIRGIGLARAGKKYKALAGEDADTGSKT